MGGVTRIPLTRGHIALVDAEDYDRVMAAGPWFACDYGGLTTYAQHNIRRTDGRHTAEKLHTFLTHWPEVDHANGDGLDNRRANLRRATRTQNNANARLRRNNTSGFKGVSWDKRTGRWMAGIRIDYRQRYLGRFDSPEEAARAYDTAARQLFGEFARTNFEAVTPS